MLFHDLSALQYTGIGLYTLCCVAIRQKMLTIYSKNRPKYDIFFSRELRLFSESSLDENSWNINSFFFVNS